MCRLHTMLSARGARSSHCVASLLGLLIPGSQQPGHMYVTYYDSLFNTCKHMEYPLPELL